MNREEAERILAALKCGTPLVSRHKSAEALKWSIAELAAANEARDALRAEVERLREDAVRYRWLRHRLMCADFSYGEFRDSVLVFEWPSDKRIGNNLDAAIDAARKE